MTIGRRSWFGLGALGLSAAALEGCGAALGSRSGASMGPEEVEQLLDDLDRVIGQLEALDPDLGTVGVRGPAARVAHGRSQCIGLLTALCLLGTYRDVPEPVRTEPRVAAHIARSLPRLQALIEAARAHVSGMSEPLLDAIDRRLLRDPDLPMRIMERVDGYAKEIGVPVEQRTYLRLGTAQLTSRFRHEGTKIVAGKVASSFDRVIDARIAMLRRTPPDEVALGLALAAAPPAPRGALLGDAFGPPRGVAGESCVVSTDCDDGLTCEAAECVEPERRSEQIRGTAGDVAKVGLWLLIPPACAIGVMVLLVSLFMVIVAGIVEGGEG